MYEGSNVQFINLVVGGQGLSALCCFPLCQKEVNASKNENWEKKKSKNKGSERKERKERVQSDRSIYQLKYLEGLNCLH